MAEMFARMRVCSSFVQEEKEAEEARLAHELDFASENAERLVELSAQVEDLQFRLGVTESELSGTRQRAERLEAELREAEEERAAALSNVEQLKQRLEESGREMESEREGRRGALEE